MRRKRRTRYTLTLPSGDRKVVLAVDAASVWDFCPEAIKVVKGDFATIDTFSTKRWPSTRGGNIWRWNRPAIAAAFEAISGFPLPSNLVLTSDTRGERTRGWFNFTGGCPTIKVRSDLSYEQANKTLWHELAHLAQFLRAGSPEQWAVQHKRERKARHGYTQRPWEREAREWEHLADTDSLLTK